MRDFYVFLDDIREPPIADWLVARHVNCIKRMLELADFDKCVIHLSLDHDLGEDEPTGYDLLNWIERKIAVDGWQPKLTFTIHSANPVGRVNMQRAIRSIQGMLHDE